jgi:hypothetical protein
MSSHGIENHFGSDDVIGLGLLEWGTHSMCRIAWASGTLKGLTALAPPEPKFSFGNCPGVCRGILRLSQ